MLDHFFFQFFTFVLLNCIVIATAVCTAMKIYDFKLENYGKLVLTSTILFFFQIFFSEIILGTLGILWFINIFIFHCVIGIIVLSLWGKKTIKQNFKPVLLKKKNLLIFLAIFSPFFIILVIRYFNALFQVPLEYDNIAYHLPFVVEWFKTGDLKPIYYSAFAGPLGYYPSNFELFDLWVLLPFGKDYLFNLVNFPIFLILIISLYKVARNLAIPRSIAMITAALFIYMPQTFRQMGVPLVDLFFCLTFTNTLYFLQEYIKKKTYADLILFSISGGLFIGTKYLGIPYMSIPFVIITIILIQNLWNKKRELLKRIFILGTGLFSGGGFWYLRNWVDSGNPLFPVDVKILGIEIFKGYYGLTERLLGYSLENNVKDIGKLKEFLHGFFQMIGGEILLISFSLAVLIIIIGKYIYAIVRIQNNKKQILKENFLSFLFLITSIFYFYLYWKAPYTYINLIPNVRYAMMFLIIGCLATGFIFSRIKILLPVLYFSALSIIIYNVIFLILFPEPNIYTNDKMILDYGLIESYPALFIAYSIILAFICIFLSLFFFKKIKIKFSVVLIMVTFIFSGLLLNTTFEEREKLIPYFYDKWFIANNPNREIRALLETAQWLDKNDPDAKIAYSGFNFHYHLFGRQLQREVDYININDCRHCRYQDFKDSSQSIRINPNFQNWIENLQAKNKKYLIVAPAHLGNVEIFEYEWAKMNRQNFKQVFKQGEVYIYRIVYL